MTDPAVPEPATGLLRLEIGAVAAGGSCVARHEGRVVFVRHALPGELVLARLTDPPDSAQGADRRYWRADAVRILRASPQRVDPPCPVSGPGGCGGCDWQHASLAAQRSGKAELVREQLRRLAALDRPDLVVEAVAVPGATDDDGLAWRTRMRFAVDDHGRLGLRAHRSHTVLPLVDCPIADPGLVVAELAARRWSEAAAVEVCLGAQPPALVVVEPADLSRPVDVPALASAVSLARRTRSGLTRLRGRTWVEHGVDCGGEQLRLRVSQGGFWQVHPAAAQVLLDAVLDLAAARAGERVLDLYAGVGLFAAGLARRVGPDGAVLAVESQARAVTDARRNLHGQARVRIRQGRVERVLSAELAQSPFDGRADVVVLDPPRAGAGRGVVETLCAARPRVVVYVACDPAALARDVATAGRHGYRLSGLRAFDLFPMTHHVECVAALEPI